MESLKFCLTFQKKMFFYSSTKLGILKPWKNIKSLRRFDLAFSSTSKQIYTKIWYKEKAFEQFQLFSRFPRKIVLYLSSKVGILNPGTNIQSLRGIDLGFLQSSEEIYRKLQYRDKIFGKFKALPDIPGKMVLHSSTKFDILKPWTNIPWPRRFDWGFSQTSKEIYGKFQ